MKIDCNFFAKGVWKEWKKVIIEINNYSNNNIYSFFFFLMFNNVYRNIKKYYFFFFTIFYSFITMIILLLFILLSLKFNYTMDFLNFIYLFVMELKYYAYLATCAWDLISLLDLFSINTNFYILSKLLLLCVCVLVFFYFCVKKILKLRFSFDFFINQIKNITFCWSILDFIQYSNTFSWSDTLEYYKSVLLWNATNSDKLAIGDDWMLLSLLFFIFCYCLWWVLHSILSYYFSKKESISTIKNVKVNYITLYFFLFLALILNISVAANIFFYFFNETFNFTAQHSPTVLFYLAKLLLSIILVIWWFLYVLGFSDKKVLSFKSKTGYSCEIILLYMILSYLFFIIISVIDFVTLILILEITSLIISILCSLSLNKVAEHNLKPIEAGLYYFMINALNTGFVLLGISMIYGATGTLYFYDIGKLCEYILEIREQYSVDDIRIAWKRSLHEKQKLVGFYGKYVWTPNFMAENFFFFPKITDHSAFKYDGSVNRNEFYILMNKFLKYYWLNVTKPHILDTSASWDRHISIPAYYHESFDLPHKSWFRTFLIKQIVNNDCAFFYEIKDLAITAGKMYWIGHTDYFFTQEPKVWAEAKIRWKKDDGFFHSLLHYFFSFNQSLLRDFFSNHDLFWKIDNWLFIEMRNAWLEIRTNKSYEPYMENFLRTTVKNTEYEYRAVHSDFSVEDEFWREAKFNRRADDLFHKLSYAYENYQFHRKGWRHFKKYGYRNNQVPILFVVGVTLFFFIFAFKLTWAPFQEWLLQVYKGGGLLFICFLATIPKIAIWFLFAKIYAIYFATNWFCNIFLFNLGIFTIVFSLVNFSKIKNILGVVAWSSVLTSGFLLIYITYAVHYNAIILIWVLFYIVVYTLGILLLFFCFLINSDILTIEFRTIYFDIMSVKISTALRRLIADIYTWWRKPSLTYVSPFTPEELEEMRLAREARKLSVILANIDNFLRVKLPTKAYNELNSFIDKLLLLKKKIYAAYNENASNLYCNDLSNKDEYLYFYSKFAKYGLANILPSTRNRYIYIKAVESDQVPKEHLIEAANNLFKSGYFSFYRVAAPVKLENINLDLISFQKNNVKFNLDNNTNDTNSLNYFGKFDSLNAFSIYCNNNLNCYSKIEAATADNADINVSVNNLFNRYDSLETQLSETTNYTNDTLTNDDPLITNDIVSLDDDLISIDATSKNHITLVNDTKNIAEISGLAMISRTQAIFLSIACFVCIGLPPFGLFIIKFIFLLISGGWKLQGSQLLISLIPMCWSFGLYGHVVKHVWSSRVSHNVSTPKNVTNVILLILQVFLITILFLFLIFFIYLLSLSFAIFWTKFQ